MLLIVYSYGFRGRLGRGSEREIFIGCNFNESRPVQGRFKNENDKNTPKRAYIIH